jgi:hypothetical protein
MDHIRGDYVEYIEIQKPVVQRVRKQMWDGNQWVETVNYRIPQLVSSQERDWLYATFGGQNIHRLGQYWCYSRSGDYTVMDEQVYMMYTLKWGL